VLSLAKKIRFMPEQIPTLAFAQTFTDSLDSNYQISPPNYERKAHTYGGI